MIDFSSEKESRAALLKGKAFDYEYPDGLDLKPGSTLSEKLITYIDELCAASKGMMAQYRQLWKKVDWKLNAYVAPEDANPRNEIKDKPREIVVPMTYRNKQVFLAALNGIFIRDPIFKYRPMPGKDSLLNAAVTEYLVQRHALWFSLGLSLNTVWGDAISYGIGVGGTRWSKKFGRKPNAQQITDITIELLKKMGGNGNFKAGDILNGMTDELLYEGTEMVPWDPYSLILDPSVTINDLQKGEYIGHTFRLNATDLIRRERDPEERRFNGWYVKVLAEQGAATSRYYTSREDGRNDRQQTVTDFNRTSSTRTGPADFRYVEISLIPSDFEIGDETWPVKFAIEIAGDYVITALHRLEEAHGEFNVVSCAPNAQGHEIIPTSHLLVTFGIQDFIDTMARATQAMAIKNVNGGWTLVNQRVVEWDDMMNPDPAKIIRLADPYVTPEMVKSAITQFPGIDSRESHMRHMEYMERVADRGNGIEDIMTGDMSQLPDRPTKAGLNMAMAGASSRMKLIGYIIGQQMMQPLGWQMAYNLVQFGRQPQSVDLTGRFAARIQRELGMVPSGSLTPQSLSLNFDMEPYSGAMPQNEDLTGVGELLKSMMGVPELAAEMFNGIPPQGILRNYMRRTGFEEMDDFINPVPVNTMPDDALEQQIQAGNMVPAGALQ